MLVVIIAERLIHLVKSFGGVLVTKEIQKVNELKDFITWHNEKTVNGIDSISECSCILKDEYLEYLYKSLNKAIDYLKEYANSDEAAGLNGAGCYNSPDEVINKWIKDIEAE